MILPLQITYRNLPFSPAVEAAIHRRATKLDTLCHRITGCRVMVEAPHLHHRKGRHYRVRVDVTLPGEEIVADRNPPLNGSHEDLYVAVRDAFEATERQVRKYVCRRRNIRTRPQDLTMGGVSA